MQDSYTVAVRNRFSILSDGVQDESASEKYGRFTKAVSDTTEELLPKVTISNRVDPFSRLQGRTVKGNCYRSI